MFEFSSRYGWWKSHTGWAARAALAMTVRATMVASYRQAQADQRAWSRAHSYSTTFVVRVADEIRSDRALIGKPITRRESLAAATQRVHTKRRKAMRVTLVLSDRYSSREDRETLASDPHIHVRRMHARLKARGARPALRNLIAQQYATATSSMRDYAPWVAKLAQQLMDEADDLSGALSAHREIEGLLFDLAFEADATNDASVDPRADQQRKDDRDDESAYETSISQASMDAFERLIDMRRGGRPTGTRELVRQAVADGWAASHVEEFSDAATNPVMIASDHGLLAAIDAEHHHPQGKRLLDRNAARAFFAVAEQRRFIERILLGQDEPDVTADALEALGSDSLDRDRIQRGGRNVTYAKAHEVEQRKVTADTARRHSAYRASRPSGACGSKPVKAARVLNDRQRVTADYAPLVLPVLTALDPRKPHQRATRKDDCTRNPDWRPNTGSVQALREAAEARRTILRERRIWTAS